MSKPILYLASASPRRHEILKQLDIPHYVLQLPEPEGEDEPQLPGELPEDYVVRIAREKAWRAAQWLNEATTMDQRQHIKHAHPPSSLQCTDADDSPLTFEQYYVLSADTTVILKNQVLGKPRDVADAKRTLRALSGTTHHVHTAIALSHQGRLSEAVSVSTVQFKDLNDAEIERYCLSGEPMGKAGAYAIQGRAAIGRAHD